ncbi:8634_t:CDS:2 [Acaulospora morrowiae]|uniref:8634_t:CDS:1 n=1 Tax=Acaulospora morrowiae TaxID=94023 RepID=A0A9N8WLB8_9GLOM|nr:8634_t:CDS:2 [Acaulospora morrowiae]
MIPLLDNFILKTTPEGVAIITLNRPNKANAINLPVLKEWLAAIQWAATTEEVKATVFTGNGRFFCGGLDLTSFASSEEIFLEENVHVSIEIFGKLVDALIDFPKPLIAAVNGNSVGFGVTFLPHCDLVYSVHNAVFYTPFVKIAICPEACATYLLPKCLGRSIANEMLLTCRQFTAHELANVGFINRLVENGSLLSEAIKRATSLAKLSTGSITETKNLIRIDERDHLKKVSRREIELLTKNRMLSQEFLAITKEFAGNYDNSFSDTL